VRPPLIVRAAGNDLPTGTRRSDPAGYRRRQPGTADASHLPQASARYRRQQHPRVRQQRRPRRGVALMNVCIDRGSVDQVNAMNSGIHRENRV